MEREESHVFMSVIHLGKEKFFSKELLLWLLICICACVLRLSFNNYLSLHPSFWSLSVNQTAFSLIFQKIYLGFELKPNSTTQNQFV